MASYRVVIALGLVAAIGLTPTPAGAQDATSTAKADKLFNEAIPLMESGDFEAAARKLEASFELDPAFATAMNLAACYEKTGKVASAWRRYRTAARLAEKNGEGELQKEANQAARGLKKDLPTLVIEVDASTRGLEGLRVTRGDQPVTSSEFGTSIYLDPGEYEIEAAAPGHEGFTTRVTAARGKSVTATIPALEATAEETPVIEPVGDTAAESDASGGGSSRRVIGWTGIGTGVVAMAVGAVFARSAHLKWNNTITEGGCDPETELCTLEGQEQADSARLHADTATVMVSAGVALVAIGTWLVWTGGDKKSPRVAPTVGADRSAGLVILGRF